MHRGLGSALLLGILGEHNRSERARHMLCRFVAVMADVTAHIAQEEISMPVHRGLSALRKLHIGESREGFPYAAPDSSSSGTVDTDSVTLLGEDGSLKLNDHSNDGAFNTSPGTETSGYTAGGGAGISGGGPMSAGPGSAIGGAGSDVGAEEYSPYSVLNTILWGSGQEALHTTDGFLIS